MPVRRKQFSLSERDFVFKRDHYRCCKCNRNLRWLPELRVLDHKLPLSKGGPDTIENIQLLCKECDGKKKDIILPEVQEEYIERRLEQLIKEREKSIDRFLKR